MTEPTPPHVPTPANKSTKTWGWIATAVAIAALIACFGDFDRSDPEPPAFDHVTACQDEVLSQLKAPATAEFVGSDRITEGEVGVMVTGEVDAQNSFGALIRSSYICSFTGQTVTEVLVI